MQNKEIIDHQLAKAREHGPLLMVGHSLGGGLAQLAATMYPQYTRTVVTFQGANIDQKDIDRLLAYNRANPEAAVTARHYRADGDIVPTSGDAAVPGQIHYFDPQWKPQGSAQPFGSSVASRAMAGHNIPLLNTYLQGMRTNNPALNLLKAAGIQDEATQPQDKTGRKRTDPKDARVVYGGSYTTAKDPRLITEGARDNAVLLQQKVTALLPFFDSPVGFREVITGELPTNTLLDHLVTQARKSASYQAFTASALKLMGLQDGTYGPVTLKVTAKDVAMAKDMGMNLPATVTVPVEVLRAFIEPGELKRQTYRRLEVIWSNLKS